MFYAQWLSQQQNQNAKNEYRCDIGKYPHKKALSEKSSRYGHSFWGNCSKAELISMQNWASLACITRRTTYPTEYMTETNAILDSMI